MSKWTARKSKETLIFSHKKVQLVWSISDDSMTFSGIYRRDKRNAKPSRKQGFTFGEGSRLWSLDLRDKLGYKNLLDGSSVEKFSYKTGETLILKWSRLADGLADVVIKIVADENRPLTRWRFEVINHSKKHTVWSLTFPDFPDVCGPTGSHRDDKLATSEGFGTEIPDPIRKQRHAVWPRFFYPSCIESMSYAALLNGGLGLYIGTQDRDARRQDFSYMPKTGEDALPMNIFIPVNNSGRHQPRVKLNYDTVLAVFEGDWYDAAQIHREWAIKQRWAKTSVTNNKDIPRWAKDLPLWIRFDYDYHHGKPHVPPSEVNARADKVLAFREALGFDIGAHVYQWHDHPFDLIYPKYNPRTYFKTVVKKFQKNGIRVMPYINGRLFDADNPDWIRDNARRYAAKENGGKLNSRAEKVFFETYNSATPMAVMCASTGYWQRKIAATIERLVKDLNLDGVYIDQIGAAWSQLCGDPKHGHPLRNGGWWVRGYEKMLEETRRRLRKTGRDVLLTTESNAEPYTGILGILMVNSVRDHNVPAFSAVYGGRALLFGRTTSAEDPVAFRIMAARNILWGCQTGWFGLKDIDLLLTKPYREEVHFLRRLCELYGQLKGYIQAGRMLRLPEISNKVKEKKVVWLFNGKWPEKISTVLTSRWQYRNRTVTTVINAHTKEQIVRIKLHDGKANTTAPKIWWASDVQGRSTFRRGKVELVMPPLSIVNLTTL